MERKRYSLRTILFPILLTVGICAGILFGNYIGRNSSAFQLRGLIQQIRADNACLSLRDLAVDGRDMLALGLSGPDIGRTLEQLLELVLDGQVPNETEALLHAAAVLSSKR